MQSRSGMNYSVKSMTGKKIFLQQHKNIFTHVHQMYGKPTTPVPLPFLLSRTQGGGGGLYGLIEAKPNEILLTRKLLLRGFHLVLSLLEPLMLMGQARFLRR